MLVDAGGGGFAGVTQAVSDLKAAASAPGGGFTISDDGARTLISTLNEVLTEVNTALAKGHTLANEPRLGSTPAANIYKPFLATIWSDGSQGGQPALTQLRQDLTDAIDTINKNSQSYQQAEAQNKAGLQQPGTELV